MPEEDTPRRDPDFVIVARTGAVRNESFDVAVERCIAYGEAGADLAMLMPSNDDEWANAAERIPLPLATIAAMDAMRAAYASFQRDGDTGVPLAKRFAVYREFSDLAGLGEFYDIEDRTTEP